MYISDSDRLSYHFVTEQDKDFLWSLDQDEEVMRYINGGKRTSREDIEGVFWPRVKAFSNPPLGWGLWKVCLQDDENTPIGWILVRPMGFFTATPQSENLELGWRFKQSYWGKGYATEAATAVRDALFEMGVDQFSAIALPENIPSIAIMKKLGMEYSHRFHYQDAVFDEEVVVYTQHLDYRN